MIILFVGGCFRSLQFTSINALAFADISNRDMSYATSLSSVSQQLAILRNKNIVESRKAGTSVYYSVRDPAVFELLDVARKIFNNQLIDTRSTLEQLEEES